MQFLDRDYELDLLTGHLSRPGAGLFVLYGRRRVGKTELLQHALRRFPGAAYHVGTRSTPVEELRRLSVTLAEAWQVPLLEAQPLASSAALLAFLRGTTGPRILVLDEFPFLVESEPSLPGLLQAAWDQALSRGGLKLVVCGSSVSMMEQTFLAPRAPLFGRRTGQLRLCPLPARCLGQAFPWSPAALIDLAAVFGGVPGYLQRLDPALDLAENLRRFVMARGEPLYEEIPFLLREELREPRVYHAILAAIATGARKFGEISSKAGLDRANLMRYLATLADLGLVEREVPVLEPRPDKSRRGLYRIADPFVQTWFSLVHPQRDLIERGLLDEAWAKASQGLARLLPLAVEPLIGDLARDALRECVPFPVAYAGRQWGGLHEFDVVLLDAARTQAFVLEVKWGEAPVARGVLADLRRRVAAEPALAALTKGCAVISKAGFTGPIAKADRDSLLGPEALLRSGVREPVADEEKDDE